MPPDPADARVGVHSGDDGVGEGADRILPSGASRGTPWGGCLFASLARRLSAGQGQGLAYRLVGRLLAEVLVQQVGRALAGEETRYPGVLVGETPDGERGAL